MAIELIAKIKQKNNGVFKLVDACDVEMANGQDLEAYLANLGFSGGEGGQEIYVGPIAPTDPNIKMWIDTSEGNADEVFSTLTEEFSIVINNLINRISDLEYEVIKLNEILNSSWTPDEPIEPPTYDYIATNEGGNVLVNEEGIILSFEGAPTPPIETFGQLLVNENDYLLTNEDGLIISIEDSIETFDTVIVNESGAILVNENGIVICTDEVIETYDNIIVNENGVILINESEKIICIEKEESFDNVMINENSKLLINEENKILIK